MDSAIFRLAAQVALTTWAIAEIAILISARTRLSVVTGVSWAVFGLLCFATWMFLSSISIYAVALISRGDLVLVFAFLELGAAVSAWGWLIANVRARFKIVAGA